MTDPSASGSDPAAAGGQTAPGWYPDPTNGQLRWWDGAQWGQYAEQQGGGPPTAVPAAGGASSATSSASMAHYLGAGLCFISCGGLGWLGPLIIFLGQGKNDPYVKDQSAEALNFQLVVLIGTIVSYVLMIVLIGFATIFIVWLIGCILPLMAGGAAGRGEAYRYPFNIRMVK